MSSNKNNKENYSSYKLINIQLFDTTHCNLQCQISFEKGMPLKTGDKRHIINKPRIFIFNNKTTLLIILFRFDQFACLF